jgi:hypothetical protein
MSGLASPCGIPEQCLASAVPCVCLSTAAKLLVVQLVGMAHVSSSCMRLLHALAQHC